MDISKSDAKSASAEAGAGDSDLGTTHVIDKMAVSKDLDVAAAYAAHDIQYEPKEARRLRWKVDLRLIPILSLNIWLGAMDKVTPSTAALYGMREDIGLVGNQYAWVGSVFYFGYLFWCIPSASVLQKYPIAKTMAVVQAGWGVVLIGTGFAKNFPTMIALRVLLGALEAPVVPGNFLVLGMWYARQEQPLRAGMMYTGFSTCFSGPIGYAVGSILTPEKWRWFFWITGMITIVWALILAIFMPDNPVDAKFINEREKAIAVDRMRSDQTGIENKTFKREQMFEALRDPKTWLMVLFNLWVSVPNGGLSNFSPLIINGLGYSPRQSTLLNIPPGAVQTLSSYICNGTVFFLARKHPALQARGVTVIAGLVVGLIASVFLYTLPITNLQGRLAALWCSFFYLGPYVVSLGINTANTAGHTKKVTTNAMIFIAYCVSNIIGPQFFLSNQAPYYPLGISVIWGSYVLAIVTMLLYMLYCWRENCRRDGLGLTREAHADTDFKDLTDKENPHFRYVW